MPPFGYIMNDFTLEPATSQTFSSSEIPTLTKNEERAIPQLNFDGLLQQCGDVPNTKLPFVWKLFEMLEGVEKSGGDHIISWVENGKAFKVHNLDAFLQKVIPKYFNQTKYRSFQRQLNFYGFKKINTGPSYGAYFHPQFLKNDKTRCLSIRPKSSKNKKSAKAKTTVNELKHTDGRWISAIGNIASGKSDRSFQQQQQQQQQQQLQQQEPVLSAPVFVSQGNHDLVFDQPFQLLQQQPQQMPLPDPLFSNSNQVDFPNDEPQDGDEVTIFGGKSFHFVA